MPLWRFLPNSDFQLARHLARRAFFMEAILPRNTYYRSAHWRALRALALRHYGERCSVPGCNSTENLTVDHIETRPNTDYPTAADTLGNVRVLCGFHDRQIKELSGKRRRDGVLSIPGADHRGYPVDPASHWWRS